MSSVAALMIRISLVFGTIDELHKVTFICTIDELYKVTRHTFLYARSAVWNDQHFLYVCKALLTIAVCTSLAHTPPHSHSQLFHCIELPWESKPLPLKGTDFVLNSLEPQFCPN